MVQREKRSAAVLARLCAQCKVMEIQCEPKWLFSSRQQRV